MSGSLYVGRVAGEKNIEAFLSLEMPGTKIVVGDGPLLEALRRKYPDVRFPGARFGEELARFYQATDVFVFPSRTDTFGLVMLKALACGLPVAAYPVSGPLDVIGNSPSGCLDEDRARAVEKALKIAPDPGPHPRPGTLMKNLRPAVSRQFCAATKPHPRRLVRACARALWAVH